MTTTLQQGGTHVRSDSYKVGWVVGLYECTSEGAGEAAQYANMYAESGRGDFLDFLEGYRAGSDLRRRGPQVSVFQIVTIRAPESAAAVDLKGKLGTADGSTVEP